MVCLALLPFSLFVNETEERTWGQKRLDLVMNIVFTVVLSAGLVLSVDEEHAFKTLLSLTAYDILLSAFLLIFKLGNITILNMQSLY